MPNVLGEVTGASGPEFSPAPAPPRLLGEVGSWGPHPKLALMLQREENHGAVRSRVDGCEGANVPTSALPPLAFLASPLQQPTSQPGPV